MPRKKKEKTKYTDKELKVFEDLVQGKLDNANDQMNFYLTQLGELADNPDTKVKGLDDATGSVESERITTMAARQKKLIRHLENAKIRIQNKVYGVCRESGKLISKERLMAVPHATLSIAAKQGKRK